MAIRMMTRKPTTEAGWKNVTIVRDYAGAEEGIKHLEGCSHFNSAKGEKDYLDEVRSFEKGPQEKYADCLEKCYYVEPLYMETSYMGAVISDGEVNGYSDSDFYAVVWNDEKQAPERVEYASTRGWSYPNTCWIDATPEVLAKYADYCAKRNAEREALQAKALAEKYAKEDAAKAKLEVAKRLLRKQVVASIAKREIRGELFWVGQSNSGKSIRCGIKDATGNVTWTSIDKVRTV